MQKSNAIAICTGFILSLSTYSLANESQKDVSKLETMTVTADKREVNIQHIPTSITAYSDKQLTNYNIDSSQELFNILPNIHLVKAGPAADIASGVSVRGITQFMSGAPSFGFYIDDVYYNEYDSNLYDIERIEFLRGPQGTLYGRNTIGGVINIITKKPTNEWSGKLSLGLGNYNTKELATTISGPLVKDRLFFRFAGKYKNSDGFVTNKYTNNDKVNNPKDIDARASLRYLATDQLLFDLSFDTLKYESGYADYVLESQINSNPHDVNVDYDGKSVKKASGINLKAEYEMPTTKLVSITTIRKDDNKLDHDMDFTTYDGQKQLYQRDYKTLSEELRLLSTDQSNLEWLIGAYGLKETQDHNLVYTLGNDWANPAYGYFAGDYPITGKTTTKTLALFGESSYTTQNKFKITAGLRYDREKQEFDYDALLAGGTKGSTSETFNALLPKLSVSYLDNSKYMPYITISKGYKSGGFNLQNNQGEKFDPEYTWNYELGLKTNLLDNKVSFNTAIYHIDWTDLQVNASNGIDFLTTNAGQATSQGIEFELNAKPNNNIEVISSFAYTKSKYDDYNVKATATKPATDFSHKYLPFVPKYTAHIGMMYSFDNGVFVNADYRYTGSVYMNNENSLREKSFSLVNAKLGYRQKNYEINLWSKNLFNKKYATVYTDFRESGGGLWARAGAPRTFGIEAIYKF